MTQQELDALQGLCDGATALMGDGWEYDEQFLTVFFSKGYIGTRQPIAEMRGGTFLMQYSGDTWDKVVPQLHANGRFIAAARTAVPQLIAEVRRLQEERDEAIADLRKDCTTCRYKGHSGLSEPCLNCQGCGYASWEWRGPQQTKEDYQ